MIKAFWGVGTNVGDTLTPYIIEFLTGKKAEWVPSTYQGKFLVCGSILEFALPGDTIFGAGHYRDEKIDLSEMRVLALRGKNSGDAPVYGDPAILLPLMYFPEIKKTKEVGYIPHLWCQDSFPEFIDVNLPWKEFVDEILSCKKIVSSSLHGFIIAQAYGVKAEWILDERIPGAEIKYQDYLTGVKDGIKKAQKDLISAFEVIKNEEDISN